MNMCIPKHQMRRSDCPSCLASMQQKNVLPKFYIFKGKHFKWNFISRCEFGAAMEIQLKRLDDGHSIDKWIWHFITFIQACGCNLSTIKCHLFILEGHNSHVILEVVHKEGGWGWI
jgi:hypothetical protein